MCCEDIVALLLNHPAVDINYSRVLTTQCCCVWSILPPPLFLSLSQMLPDQHNRMQRVTPLADAAARGKVPIVRMLVEHGAHINKTSEDVRTPLSYTPPSSLSPSHPLSFSLSLSHTPALTLQHSNICVSAVPRTNLFNKLL